MKPETIFIRNCLEKDPRAEARFFNRYFHKMYLVCLKMAKNESDAQDILQEGFIKVFRNLESFRNEGPIEAWMRRIMINTSYNFYKRKYPEFTDIDFDTTILKKQTSDSAIDIMSEKDLKKLIEELPAGYQTVFRMSALEGYTHREIASKLSISRNTSKSQLNRAKTSLREKIRNHYHYEDFKGFYENTIA